MENTTFIITEDQDMILKGLCAHVSSIPGFTVLGMAPNGAEALDLIKEYGPDIVLMDLKMPQMDGPLATKRIKEYSSDIKVIILTAYTDEVLIFEALDAGADGYLLKNVSDEEFIFAVKTVKAGKKYITPEITLVLVEKFLHARDFYHSPLLAKLSERETAVLTALASGYTVKETAAKLFISPKTVETHKVNIKNKLNAKTTTDIIVFAIQNSLVDTVS